MTRKIQSKITSIEKKIEKQKKVLADLEKEKARLLRAEEKIESLGLSILDVLGEQDSDFDVEALRAVLEEHKNLVLKNTNEQENTNDTSQEVTVSEHEYD